MNLSELRNIKEGEIIEDDNEEEYEESDIEADFSNSLALLQDAAELFAVLSSKGVKGWPKTLNQYMGKQIVKVGQEIESFLSDYDMNPDDPANQQKVA